MSEVGNRLLQAIERLLTEQMAASPARRDLIVALAEWVLAQPREGVDGRPAQPAPAVEPAGEAAAVGPASEESTADGAGDQPRSAPAIHLPRAIGRPTIVRAPEARPLPRQHVPLAIGGARIEVEVGGSRAEFEAAARAADHASSEDGEAQRSWGGMGSHEIDLGLIVERCRLKAESCRLFIERRAAFADPLREPEVLDRMNRMIDRAKSMRECFLWVFWRDKAPPDDVALREIAACYESLAECAALCSRAVDAKKRASADQRMRAFELFAEACSAMREALAGTWLTSPDRDQDDAHHWLRRETTARRIYVSRHMTLSDPADPSRAREVAEDARALLAQLTEIDASERRIEPLLNKLKYHSRRLPATGAAEAHDCQTINDAVNGAVSLGVPASDPRLTAHFEHIDLAVFPEAAPPSDAVREVARYAGLRSQKHSAAARAAEEPADDAGDWSDRVLEVRELLRGGSIVVIGGEPRQDAIGRLTDAFDLARVDWVHLTEHGTASPARAPISRPETRLVLVLIKLCGHIHADEARQYARDAGKVCISMPAGYNPEQVAERVLAQAAARL